MSAARASFVAALAVAAIVGHAKDARALEPRGDDWTALGPLDHVVPLALAPGQDLFVRGALRTSFDGAVFNAATRTDFAGASSSTRPGGLFDIAGGGLALTAWDPSTHVARFAASGADAPACRALGVAPPCLVPRTAELAHERLLSVDELQRTLTGSIELAAPPPVVPLVAPSVLKIAAAIVASFIALILAALALAWRLARRRSPIGQVRIAAAEAEAATRGDAMLAPVAAQIAHLLDRAAQLEAARRACAKRLAKIDRRSLAERRARVAVSTAPESAEALAWVNAECAEASRLESDLAASLLGVERIASALRVITLRARSHRGVRVRVATPRASDPVDTLAAELAIRDEAIAEADRVA